jgi:hypothetical protein
MCVRLIKAKMTSSCIIYLFHIVIRYPPLGVQKSCFNKRRTERDLLSGKQTERQKTRSILPLRYKNWTLCWEALKGLTGVNMALE